MDCKSCLKNYSDSRLPRLLVACGHTLCQPCIKDHLRNGLLKCPECGISNIAQSVDNFPRNLAVLSLGAGTGGKRVDQCPTHTKRYQAFCQKDNQLVCIECILAQHRLHPVISLKQACTKEAELLDLSRTLSVECEGRIGRACRLVDQAGVTISGRLQQALGQVSLFFGEARGVLEQEEEQWRNRIRDVFQGDQTRLKDIKEQLNDKLAAIRKFREANSP